MLLTRRERANERKRKREKEKKREKERERERYSRRSIDINWLQYFRFIELASLFRRFGALTG